ncbi:MAG: hypothetical protein QOD55_2711, partial [Solirubrobacteraceae bacterium]|nr:hypothetical protein [Solirubrobacteraceae bacterium]
RELMLGHAARAAEAAATQSTTPGD